MGKKIKIARVLADKTQEQLSKETGISKDYISMLERGVTNNPTLEVMKKLSKALDTPVVDLFFSDEQ